MALKSTDPYTRSTGTVASKITTYDANGLATNGTQSGYTYSFGNGADTYDFTANTGKITADWQQISGGNGSDYIKGSTFSDIIWGDSVTNSQTSDNGADTLLGGDGNDQIHGGNGADVLEGDKGADVLWGDRGGDTFKYVLVTDSSAKSTGGWSNVTGDVISDFNASEGDRLDLAGLNLQLTGAASGTLLTWGSGPAAYHVWASGGIVYADTTGDNVADVAIKVIGAVDGGSFIGVNHDPVGKDDTGAGNEDTVITGNLRTNDSDSDGDQLFYTLSGSVAGLAVNADGTYSFNAGNAAYQHLAQGATQVVTATINVSDHHGGVATEP
jgi:VCBS repeat-containing protein